MNYNMNDIKSSYLDSYLNSRSWPIWLSCTTLVAALAIFANIVTIHGTFIFDDHEALVKNADVNNLSTPFKSLFRHDFWGKNISSHESHKSYRPVTIIALRLQHYLFGSLNPKSYHKFNIGLHVLNTIMCLGVVSIIWGKRDKQKKGILFASSLFAVHPIHTETVASIVGQADMFYTIFCLLGFLIYHYNLITSKNNKGNSLAGNLNCLLIVGILTLLSMFSKEQGIMTMVICSLYDIIFHQPEMLLIFKNIFPNRRNSTIFKKQQVRECCSAIFYLLFRITSMALITVMLLIVRMKLMVRQPAFNKEDNPHSYIDSSLLRVINYSYIYWMNTWLLLDPWWLCCDWSYDCIPILNSAWNLRTLAALAFWIVIILIGYRIIKFWKSANTRRILLASIFWIVPFTPASNIFFRVGFVIAERNLYLPSLGFCIAVSLGFCILHEKFPHHSQLLNSAAVCLIFVFIVRSHQRNKDWLDGKQLFSSGLKVCPSNAKLYFNIAVGYLHHKEYKSAKNYFTETVRIYPYFVSAYSGLAQCYLNLENYPKAEYYYKIAANSSLQIDREEILLKLCYIKYKLEKINDAKQCINTLIKRYPSLAYKAYYGLAEIYYYNGEKERALAAWMKAIELNSTNSAAWETAVAYLHHLNRRKESIWLFRKALRHVSDRRSLQNVWARLQSK